MYPWPGGGPLEPAILTTNVLSPILYPFSPLAASCTACTQSYSIILTGGFPSKALNGCTKCSYLGVHDHAAAGFVKSSQQVRGIFVSAHATLLSLTRAHTVRGDWQKAPTWAMLGVPMVTKP